jgi:hypothetical protein
VEVEDLVFMVEELEQADIDKTIQVQQQQAYQ